MLPHALFIRSSLSASVSVIACAILAGVANANPTLGFHERFIGTSVGNWAGGAVVSNPGTGGAGGAGDGYLKVSTPNGLSHNLGSSNTGLEYTGNWTAAGVTQLRLQVSDVGAAQPLELHFCIGNISNFWQYNPMFVPPQNAWGIYVVNLANPGLFTHIIDSPPGGTFAAALASVDRILIRHDYAPYAQTPDPLDGDFGVDNILLTDGTVGVGESAVIAGRAIELSSPVPNPSNGAVTLSMESFDYGAIRIEVIDVTGRALRHVELAPAPAGTRSWTWDGTDDTGHRLAAGVYRVRAFGASGGTSRAVVRVD